MKSGRKWDSRLTDGLFDLLSIVVILLLSFMAFKNKQCDEKTVVELESIVVSDSALYWSGKYDINVELARKIMELAEEYGFNKELVFSVIQTESSFNPTARSHVGAVGLMQVMPATAKIYMPDITLSELYDVDTNLRIGLSYLRDMHTEFGDTRAALVAYNAGPSRARRILDKHGTDVYYVRSVMGD